MKAVEKRNLVVKEVIKPLLKQAGFRCKKTSWWKELEDGYLFVYMKNSIFNSQQTGSSFCFQFSASYANEIHDSLENQWIENQCSCLEERDFLPYHGLFSQNRSNGLGYQIDGYKNYQLLDTPVEEIISQIKNDFEQYILPAITDVKCVQDFTNLKEKAQKRLESTEFRLLRFYSLMQMYCCDDSNLELAVQTLKEDPLTKEEIYSHYDWLDIITKNSAFPDMDAKVFIEKVIAKV